MRAMSASFSWGNEVASINLYASPGGAFLLLEFMQIER
jgi:hypothetical protein